MCLFLFQAFIPTRYWDESLHTATYLHNRLPTTTIVHPHHTLLFLVPLPFMTIFIYLGVRASPTIQPLLLISFAPRSACVLLGYSPNHKGYRCLDLTTHRLLISLYVVFGETDFPFSTSNPLPPPFSSWIFFVILTSWRPLAIACFSLVGYPLRFSLWHRCP